MGTAAAPADADRRRVFAQDQAAAASISQVVDEPALKGLGILEIHQAEQKDFQGRG
jgi:hypothetical protein